MIQPLIIDNGTRYLAQLASLVGKDTPIVSYQNIKDFSGLNDRLLILSGGHGSSVVHDPQAYEQEIDLIRSNAQSILGVCLGFELIAYAFGAKLALMPKREHGTVTITVTQPEVIGPAGQSFQVYENHRWVVTDPGPELVGVAQSKDGYEVIRHRTRPIFGFQFHPEMFDRSPAGREIFEVVLKHLRND